MKLALITPGAKETGEGLGVGLDDERVLDVSSAVDLARGRRGVPEKLPASRTVKQFINAAEDEAEALHELIQWVERLPTGEAETAGIVRPEREVRFHPPIPDPEKFICVGKNYRAHLDELVRTNLIKEIPEEPTGFVKLNSVLTAHGDEVARPQGIVEFDYEPELAFVIGSGGRGVSRQQAENHIFGITLFNDLTAREIQRQEVRSGTRFWTAKNMPGFGPIGPYVVTLDEIQDMHALDIECYVNGEIRMKLNTCDQIFKAPEIIEHFSRYLPMKPGDIFATGSAAGVAVGQENAAELFLRPGDVVEVVLPGVMKLTTRIVADTQIPEVAGSIQT